MIFFQTIISIIFALICLIVVCIISYDYINVPVFVSSIFLLVAFASLIFMYPFLYWEWEAASCKAKIINSEFDKNYTREDFFYCEDLIKKIFEEERNK